jgi:tetratricopeptide (TPR) repeat protein
MRAVLALVVATGLLAAAGCARKPASWKEWIDEAPAAFKAEQYTLALEHCRKAFDYALAEKNGPRAIGALECMAEAAQRAGKMEAIFPAFDTVLRDYDDDLRISGAGLRLRNNYAAALVDAGRKQDGVNLFDETLDAYEGSPQRSRDNYRVRMQLVANLARTVRVFPDSEESIRVSTVILAEILNHVENARFRKNLPYTLGTADAMAAIAHLIRLRGDPVAAEELMAKSREQQAIEDEVLEGRQRRVPCEPVTIRSLMLRSCYAAVP